ncbi:MAG: dihydropteroate synthase [Pseudomonadota bacterium]
MNLLSEVSTGAQLYLQPASFCAPQLTDPNKTVQIAGLPVWASACRIIARGYDGRVLDHQVDVPELMRLMEGEPGLALKPQFARLTRPAGVWQMGGKALRLSEPRLMAVLNVTPDSFSDGGDMVDAATAIEAGERFAAAGADIIDIGGESTRPGATTVWEGEELDRVIPVVSALAGSAAAVSIDTRKAAVMETALESGANIINDVSALRFDEAALPMLAKRDCPIILMHAQGDPQTMQNAPRYDDAVLDVYDALEARIEACEAAGIKRSRLAIDPGIGFGKLVQHNLSLINNLGLFHSLGCPVVLGVSRKRFIGALADVEEAKERFPGSLAAALKGMMQGVHIVRVHDISQTRQALDIWRALTDEMQMPPAIS